jgi:hypothetical protein
MEGPDDVIHQPIRLRVMPALTALDPSDDGLDFAQLKTLTGATDGNLGAHLDHFARAGYVGVTKSFVARRPRTTVKAECGGPGGLRPPGRVFELDHRGDVSGS